MGRTTSLTLDQAEWEEIFYALETKAQLVEQGHFGPEDNAGDDAKWIRHMKKIMNKINKHISR